MGVGVNDVGQPEKKRLFPLEPIRQGIYSPTAE
jgi:hypothetical protein